MPEEPNEHHRIACHLRIIRRAVLPAAVAIAAFVGGYLMGQRRQEELVREQSANRFREFISVGIDLGIIKVDEDKLNEVICTGSEGEWEDRDAAQRAEGGRP